MPNFKTKTKTITEYHCSFCSFSTTDKVVMKRHSEDRHDPNEYSVLDDHSIYLEDSDTGDTMLYICFYTCQTRKAFRSLIGDIEPEKKCGYSKPGVFACFQDSEENWELVYMDAGGAARVKDYIRMAFQSRINEYLETVDNVYERQCSAPDCSPDDACDEDCDDQDDDDEGI
jgi:hypothetical protein